MKTDPLKTDPGASMRIPTDREPLAVEYLAGLPEHEWEVANSKRKAVGNVLNILDQLAAESNREGFEP
jgi:hypothetical protein